MTKPIVIVSHSIICTLIYRHGNLQKWQHDSGALEAELNRLAIGFEKGETEETWLKFEEALQRLMAIALGSSSVPGFASMVKTKLKKALLGSVSRFCGILSMSISEMGATYIVELGTNAIVSNGPVANRCTGKRVEREI